MFSRIWDFLKEVVAGIWAVVSFRAKNKPRVSADHSSVAAGRDIKSSPININARGSSEPTAKNSDHKRLKSRGGSKR